MMGEAVALAEVGARRKCSHCGKAVWFRLVGVMGYSGHHPRQPVYQWCARKGSKPRPSVCIDDCPHDVEGYAMIHYGPAEP